MLSYAQFVFFAVRGARWGDLEVLDLEDIEEQIAKNPIKLRKVVVREEVAVVVVPKIDWSLRRPAPVTKPLPDLEAGWAVVKKKVPERKAPVPEWRAKPNKPNTKQGYREGPRKPCCSYFEETCGKKHSHDCKRKN